MDLLNERILFKVGIYIGQFYDGKLVLQSLFNSPRLWFNCYGFNFL